MIIKKCAFFPQSGFSKIINIFHAGSDPEKPALRLRLYSKRI